MFAFQPLEEDTTLDRKLPVLKFHQQVHHIALACLYETRINNELYCGQIYMYDAFPHDALRYKSKFQSNINLYCYVGEIIEILQQA